MSANEFDRRVYQREFQSVIGYGTTWFRKLESEGKIPPARRDPLGRRKWWLASEVRATVEKMAAAAETQAA